VVIAVLLAGGQGSRLGGRHKPGIALAGRTLLDRALDAVADADRIVVVGPATPTAGPPDPRVRWTLEHPRGGGPVAALAAGLAHEPEPPAVPEPPGEPDPPGQDTEHRLSRQDTDVDPSGQDTEVVLLAADLLGVTSGTVARLRAALAADRSADGVVLCDAGGRWQWLIGVWRLGPLRSALPAEPRGRSLRSVLSGLAVTAVPELPGESSDVDTPDDLARAIGDAGEGPVTGGPSQPSHW
jgi:molybdenum cofactor guanylyltransferase